MAITNQTIAAAAVSFAAALLAAAASLLLVSSPANAQLVCQVPDDDFMMLNATICVDFCDQLTVLRPAPETKGLCELETYLATIENIGYLEYVHDCLDIAMDPMSPIVVGDLGYCGMIDMDIQTSYDNGFSPSCEDSASRCPRGPSIERADLDEEFLALLSSGEPSFIRPYTGSGGVPDAYTMTFGLVEPRMVAEPILVDGIPAIPVYVALTFSAPTNIDGQAKTIESTILIDEFFDLTVAESLYGYPLDEPGNDPDCDCFFDGPLVGGNCTCELDTWTVNTVFDNLRERQTLLEASESLVDCGSGWCAELMPEGYFFKRTSYFQGTFTQQFDFSRYPFDSQEFWVNFTMQVPYGYVSLQTLTSTFAVKKSIGSFYYDTIECYHKNTENQTWGGSCVFRGSRVSGPSVINLVLPSLLFVLIAFSSLAISVSKSMPRVAMTMFALLVVTQQRSQIIATLPPSQQFVWIDMYLFCCIIVIVLIMWSHAFSERLAEKARTVHQVMLDRVLLFTLPVTLVVLVVMVTMAALGVPRTTWLVTGITILAVVVVGAIVWYARSIFTAFQTMGKASEDLPAKDRWLKLGRRFKSMKEPDCEQGDGKKGVGVTSFADAVEDLETKRTSPIML